MVRLLAVLAALGVAAWATSSASQNENPSKQSERPLVTERLPVAVGDTWTYRNFQTDTGHTNRTWVETVLTVDDQSITIRRTDRLFGSNRELPAVDNTKKLGEGFYNFPLYVGKIWQSADTRNGVVVGSTSYRVIASEVIDTSVGKFETLKIECSFKIDGQKFQQMIWFAPSVRNVVKLRYTGSAQATELISYHLSD